jgi:hypothetical protein
MGRIRRLPRSVSNSRDDRSPIGVCIGAPRGWWHRGSRPGGSIIMQRDHCSSIAPRPFPQSPDRGAERDAGRSSLPPNQVSVRGMRRQLWPAADVPPLGPGPRWATNGLMQCSKGSPRLESSTLSRWAGCRTARHTSCPHGECSRCRSSGAVQSLPAANRADLRRICFEANRNATFESR